MKSKAGTVDIGTPDGYINLHSHMRLYKINLTLRLRQAMTFLSDISCCAGAASRICWLFPRYWLSFILPTLFLSAPACSIIVRWHYQSMFKWLVIIYSGTFWNVFRFALRIRLIICNTSCSFLNVQLWEFCKNHTIEFFGLSYIDWLMVKN